MIVVGLSGSAAMGKSTAAQVLREKGIPIFDADQFVRDLYEDDAFLSILQASFPEVFDDGGFNKDSLRDLVAKSPGTLTILEDMIHPEVRKAEEAWLDEQRGRNAKLVVLEVPLLFETSADKLCDVTVVVSAGEEIQMQRLQARGWPLERVQKLLSHQWSDEKKRKAADYVIDTSGPLADTQTAIEACIEKIERHYG